MNYKQLEKKDSELQAMLEDFKQRRYGDFNINVKYYGYDEPDEKDIKILELNERELPSEFDFYMYEVEAADLLDEVQNQDEKGYFKDFGYEGRSGGWLCFNRKESRFDIDDYDDDEIEAIQEQIEKEKDIIEAANRIEHIAKDWIKHISFKDYIKNKALKRKEEIAIERKDNNIKIHPFCAG